MHSFAKESFDRAEHATLHFVLLGLDLSNVGILEVPTSHIEKVRRRRHSLYLGQRIY